MVLFDDIVEVLDAPQLTVGRQHFLFDGSGERLRIRSMLIDPVLKRQPGSARAARKKVALIPDLTLESIQ